MLCLIDFVSDLADIHCDLSKRKDLHKIFMSCCMACMVVEL